MINPEPKPWIERRALPIAALLLLAFLALGLGSAPQKSATRDEGVHLARGVAILKTGDFRLSIHHPPLMNVLSALPLFLSGRNIVFPQGDPSWQTADKDRFAEVLAQANRQNLLLFLFLGRLPTLLLAALLGCFLFRFSRELFGTKAALLSLTLYCFDPTILAHSRLITTDLAVTAGTFFVIYALWRFYQAPSLRRLTALSVLLGLALLTKYSAMLLVPLVFVILAAAYWLDPDFRSASKNFRGAPDRSAELTAESPRRAIRALRATLFLILGLIITLLVVWSGYFFDLSPWPWSRYLHGFLATEKLLHHASNYFLGQTRDTGFRSYYLVLFLLKTPLGTLILLALSLVVRVRVARVPSPAHPSVAQVFQPAHRLKLLPIFIFLPAITFFMAASFLNDLNIGVRYVLPAYPLLFLWIGRLLASGARLTLGAQPTLGARVTVRLSSRLKASPAHFAQPLPRWRRYVVPALAGWTVAASLWIWPDYLMYWNPIAGGPDRAWRIAVAGEDWGQDLPGLARYVKEHGIENLHYNVYGIGMPSLYSLHYQTFPCSTPVSGWVAVHMVDLYRPRAPGCYDWLKAYSPVAKVGYTIWIYRIE